jgi:flagellar protein FliL
MESTISAEAAVATTPQEPQKRKPVALIATILAGLAVGGGVGLFVLGPSLAPKAEAQAAAPGIHDARKDGAIGKESDAPKILHIVDNLVLNPANSGGTRFLMVNATFELKESSAQDRLKIHDPEVRDVLLAVLGAKTVEELADVTQREALKKEMLAAVQKLFPDAGIKRVYFPQFVIQ